MCGDSARKKRAARLYIYEREGRLLVRCHNCQYSTIFPRFLRQVDPELYSEFVLEEFQDGRRSVADPHPVHDTPPERFRVDMSALDALECAPEDLPADHPAAQFILSRLIPPFAVHYVKDFYGFAEACVPGTYAESARRERKEPRIVIPFRDRGGDFVGFQGRSLDPKHPAKYVTVILDKTRPFLYGLDRVDDARDVYLLEGPIDAMMIGNAVASGGGDVTRELERAGLRDPVVVYDNEPRSPHTARKMRAAAERGLRVCVWPEWLEHKDLNDMRCAGMSRERVEELIRTCTRRGVEALAAMTLWEVLPPK